MSASVGQALNPLVTYLPLTDRPIRVHSLPTVHSLNLPSHPRSHRSPTAGRSAAVISVRSRATWRAGNNPDPSGSRLVALRVTCFTPPAPSSPDSVLWSPFLRRRCCAVVGTGESAHASPCAIGEPASQPYAGSGRASLRISTKKSLRSSSSLILTAVNGELRS
jgi:hypothetical protein